MHRRGSPLVIASLACMLLLGAGASKAEDVSLEDDEIVLVEDVIDEPSRRDHSGTDPNDPTQPKKRSRTGKGKEKYDSRRANSSEKPKPKPEAYKKFSDEDLKKPEQREIVMDESERALFAALETTDKLGSKYMDDEHCSKLTDKLLTVLKPFRYHHNLLQRGKHDEDVVERANEIQAKFVTIQERLKAESERHQLLMTSTSRLFGPKSEKTLRLYIKKRIKAGSVAELPPPPGMVVNLATVSKKMSSAANAKLMLAMQQKERGGRKLGLVKEELIWFFAIALTPFVVQLAAKVAMVVAVHAVESIFLMDAVIAVVPSFAALFKTASWVGFVFLNDTNLICLGCLTVFCAMSLFALSSYADALLQHRAYKKRMAARTLGEVIKKKM